MAMNLRWTKILVIICIINNLILLYTIFFDHCTDFLCGLFAIPFMGFDFPVIMLFKFLGLERPLFLLISNNMNTYWVIMSILAIFFWMGIGMLIDKILNSKYKAKFVFWLKKCLLVIALLFVIMIIYFVYASIIKNKALEADENIRLKNSVAVNPQYPNSLSWNVSDLSICEKLSDYSQNSKDSCYKSAAMNTKNATICEKVSLVGDKSWCYYLIAKDTKDKSLCDKITYSVRDQKECYSM